MTITHTPTAPKWWGNSLTIQGAMLSAASAMLPGLGALIGLDVNGEMLRQIGEQSITAVQAIGGLAGMVMTIAGRTRASQPLTLREVRMKI